MGSGGSEEARTLNWEVIGHEVRRKPDTGDIRVQENKVFH